MAAAFVDEYSNVRYHAAKPNSLISSGRLQKRKLQSFETIVKRKKKPRDNSSARLLLFFLK
ncbi:hypothetical protein [Flavobacterium pectinovorum]|uniref:Integrase catalytic domain-containing protein n=1 Tax=Flavobacterium pectinovorum TaxID=29533 RepID=A0AB36P5X2_9FLAO|nr:hypothetical protein [Flavobacterium pectinovorum]OXB07754.1 hypothetical protein B0A72_02495 [Flavobacterium pectinovorum]